MPQPRPQPAPAPTRSGTAQLRPGRPGHSPAQPGPSPAQPGPSSGPSPARRAGLPVGRPAPDPPPLAATPQRAKVAGDRRACPGYSGTWQDPASLGVVGEHVEDHFTVAADRAHPLQPLDQAPGKRRASVPPPDGPPVRTVAAELIDHPDQKAAQALPLARLGEPRCQHSQLGLDIIRQVVSHHPSFRMPRSPGFFGSSVLSPATDIPGPRRNPGRMRVMSAVTAALPTPVGELTITCTASGVARVRIGPGTAGPGTAGPATAGPATTSSWPAGTGPADRAPADIARQPAGDEASSPGSLLAAAIGQLTEYFAGLRRAFDLPLDWGRMPPVHRRVLGELYRSVGYGETLSYGALASRAGVASGRGDLPARVVGQAMGANPIPIIIPCHRVVASNGLGGYSGGTGPEVKRWLLIFEGAWPPVLDWDPAGLPAAQPP